jgi:IS5 family transposase
MRQRFEAQLLLGQLPIEDFYLSQKSKSTLDDLLRALHKLYCEPDYNSQIFSVLEKYLKNNKKNTGRKGLDLWIIFVLAQLRLCKDLTYEDLHNLANNHHDLRHLMGVEREHRFERVEFTYQNIYDNVSSLSDQMLKELNEIIVKFGNCLVFKKKEGVASALKTDSYVVEANVHFPTDYNLLYDCIRKCCDTLTYFQKNNPSVKGYRKMNDWHKTLKNLMRQVGQISSKGGANKEERLKKIAQTYLEKAKLFEVKMKKAILEFPQTTIEDIAQMESLLMYIDLMVKHIDLVNRRIMLQEVIPHEEKIFSIFEQYTEWITKGKQHRSVELGKKLLVTSNEFNLIVDYQIMENQSDSQALKALADRISTQYRIGSWSFDKGFYSLDNKEYLKKKVDKVIMPKKGKCNKEEKIQESTREFKKLRNKHSAIESNINELENRGLNRCPDRNYEHFKTYVALGICAYNLKKIGRELLKQQINEERKKLKSKFRLAA